MTVREGQEELERQFAQWRHYVQGRRELQPSDADELEDHLRGSVDELIAAGLSADEAFLVAVKRMGSLDELSREFAREHSERLWKQLVLTGETGSPAAGPRARQDLRVMVACAAGAAVSIKVPELFGLRLTEDGSFYGPNVGLFALPWLAAFLAWRRQARRPLIGMLVALFAVGAVAANVYPLAETSQSVVITSIHLPIALWLVVGLAYVADDWRSSRRRMDFIRFTGECFVYFVLIALGGGVLTAFMFGTFKAIGIVPEAFISAVAAAVRRHGRDRRGRLARRGQAGGGREHRPGTHAAVHAALHRGPAGLPRCHRLDQPPASTSSARR